MAASNSWILVLLMYLPTFAKFASEPMLASASILSSKLSKLGPLSMRSSLV